LEPKLIGGHDAWHMNGAGEGVGTTWSSCIRPLEIRGLDLVASTYSFVWRMELDNGYLSALDERSYVFSIISAGLWW
jgi:hypothetical protein